MAVRARDLIGHDAENLAAEGELEFLQLLLLSVAWRCGRQQARDRRDAAQHGAAVEVRRRKIGARQPLRNRSGVVGIAATHGISPGAEFPPANIGHHFLTGKFRQ
jgi:hypothetical protein